ncbi:MAG: DUF3987 domain-containing protein [Xanthomonadales bacterium]|nr:DUF3987 domain-containing protein [Xanthomonadales bacterium]
MLRANDAWRGLIATPPQSPLERVLSAFKAHTNVALEVPFFVFLHFVSGILIKRGTVIQGKIGTISPELWTIILAPSGSGKSLSHQAIEKSAPVRSEFPETASAARFIEALAEQSPALWFQDEIAQILKQIENPASPLGEMKSYLLRTYDNAPVERSTLKSSVRVERPVLGILGLNTPESFQKALSPESLLDGFAQRFGFVWAERDPLRPMHDYPIFDMPALELAAKQAFDGLPPAEAIPLEFTLTPEAEEAFAASFTLMGQGQEENESYFRRAMFRAFKYAALYHLILGKTAAELDATDIGWGARVSAMHLADMGKVLRRHEAFDDLAVKVAKAKQVKASVEADGQALTPRVLQQRVRGVRTAAEAKALFELL